MKKFFYSLALLFLVTVSLEAIISSRDPAQDIILGLHTEQIMANSAAITQTVSWATLLFTLAEAALFFLLAQILFLLTFDPDQPDVEPKDLNESIVSIREGVPLPVVFGVAKLGTTVINHDKSTFRTKRIYDEKCYTFVFVSKCDTYVAAHDYFYSWVSALACGELDYFRRVWEQPRDEEVENLSQSNWTPFNGNIGSNKRVIIAYPGTRTQTRGTDAYSGNNMNYRGTAFIVYDDYYLGRDVADVPAHIFEVKRYPKPVDENGNPFGMNTAIGDEANPAAVVYEALTDSNWGKGLSPTKIDKASFVDCSNYFASKNIGVNYTLEDKTTISAFLDLVNKHTDLIVQYIDAKLTCIITSRQDTYYDRVVNLDSRDIINFSLNRESWQATFNEIRANFRDKEKEYKNSNVHLMEKGNISLTNGIRSFEESYEMFVRRSLVVDRAEKLLKERSVPKAVFNLTLNRHGFDPLPSDLISIDWNNWFEGRVKLYARVTRVVANGGDVSEIKVTAEQDINTPPFVFNTPVPTPEDPDAEVVVVDKDSPESVFEDPDLSIPDDSDVNIPPEVDVPLFIEPLPITAEDVLATKYTVSGNIILFETDLSDPQSSGLSVIRPSVIRTLEAEGNTTLT